MRGLYFDGNRIAYREDLPEPERLEGESLIQVHLAGVCNTDREMLRGYRPDFKGVLGHEFVGTVVASDRADWVGRRVVGELNQGCGHCDLCRKGLEKHCLQRRVLGIHGRSGCFAERFTLPTRLLHLVPEQLADEEAIYTEPFAAALQILEADHIPPTASVAVIGDGRLALMCTQVLARLGLEPTILGRHPEKWDNFAPFAKTDWGKNYHEPQFDWVVEASGSPSGLEQALEIVQRAGCIILKSTYAQKTSLDMSQVAVHELSIKGSRCGPFEPALRLLAKGQVKLPAVSLYAPEQWQEALSGSAFKSVFDFRQKP